MVLVNPRGPHHRATCSGWVHIRKTSSRGASKTRVAVISRSEVLAGLLLLAFSGLLLVAYE
jgi:hypothetical protein